MKTLLSLTLMFAFSGMLAVSAQVIFDTPSTYAGPVTTGLNDNVYHATPSAPPFVDAPTSDDITAVETYAANNAPDYTFLNTATTFSYSNNDDNNTTAGYLAADANGAALDDTADIGGTIFDALGYLNVTDQEVGETFTFTFDYADDAARLSIGGDGTPGNGTVVIEQDYFGDLATPSSQTVVFTAAGYYAIEVLHYQNFGGANLHLSTSVTGDGNTVDFVVAETPEPSTYLLAGLGLVALLFVRRRRPA